MVEVNIRNIYKNRGAKSARKIPQIFCTTLRIGSLPRKEIRDEIADVFKAVLYLSHKLKIDPIEAAYQKFEKMKQKYPADKCRGKSLKHTAYENP
jgi:NTP pyrophosphatase (non-canonical NTP hydrolase)